MPFRQLWALRARCVLSALFGVFLVSPLAAQAEGTAAAPAVQSAGDGAAEADDRTPRVDTLAIQGDLAGELDTYTTHYEDTFAAIGTREALGFLELVKANPGVDPWLPGEGTVITLPRQYVMPMEVKRNGIVINLSEYRLYYFTDEDHVQVYPVGVGTDENPSPLTDAKVVMPLESPAWYVPESIRAAAAAKGNIMPRMVPPGPDNPLGTHALLLSADGYLIHGTNKKFGVGLPVSHGCFRMYNEDISRFVYEVSKGTPVQIIRQPVKLGLSNGEVWMEAHRPREKYTQEDRDALWQAATDALEAFQAKHPDVQLKRRAIELAIDQGDGLPTLIGERVTQMASDDNSRKPKAASAQDQPENGLYF
ncbi:L,D-transpeptidase family protein [Marinobacter sp. C2H3]|uniref:L,D-transpeptidase family protein n=1 Tax=Marinobacter sp. C2H3 TaxID=3119003 RepID=UPI00300F7B1D